MAYKAPIWEDGKSPAISAENLNALSQAAEGAQVLYGNSAPTSSTEGAVGQFYLVVVADSDGNYPLYQCVAIANGSYTWRDTRRIPDSITSMLGIPAPGTINRALNVLANIGNLHVWKRVQTYAEEQHTYTLGEKTTGVALAAGTGAGYQQIWYCSDKITVSDSLEISLVSPSTVNFYSNTTTEEFMSAVAGKFIKYKGHGSEAGLTLSYAGVYFCPGDSAFGNVQYSQYEVYKGITNAQIVTAVTIPAGTHVDYLTSTDRDAYPDQSAAGGQDAYYTLGDVVSGNVVAVNSSSGTYVKVKHSSTLDVSEDGTISFPTTATTTEVKSTNSSNKESDFGSFKGKFVQFSTDYGNVDIYISGIIFIPENATFSGTNNVSVSYQPVTGHAAIPANTTITYLGQLGGGARIEVGSYVGTGTYGSSNPCSITLSKDSAIVFILKNGVFFGVLSIYDSIAGGFSLISTSSGPGKYFYSFLQLNVSASGNTISWWHKSDSYQLNVIGNTYTWVALAID